MTGRSIHTIRAVEQRKLALSHALAVKASKATGVSVEWLLDEVDTGLTPMDIAAGKKNRAAIIISKFVRIMQSARKRPDFDLIMMRVEQLVKKLEREFPPTKKGS